MDAIIAEMVRRIVSSFDPERVILFGSRARGDARPDSDIDLLVVLTEVPDRKAARVAVRRVLADIPWAKDVLVAGLADFESAELPRWDVVAVGRSEGTTLYERGGGNADA